MSRSEIPPQVIEDRESPAMAGLSPFLVLGYDQHQSVAILPRVDHAATDPGPTGLRLPVATAL